MDNIDRKKLRNVLAAAHKRGLSADAIFQEMKTMAAAAKLSFDPLWAEGEIIQCTGVAPNRTPQPVVKDLPKPKPPAPTPDPEENIFDLSREERQELIIELLDSNPTQVYRRTDIEYKLGYVLEGEVFEKNDRDSLTRLVQRDLQPLVQSNRIQKRETTVKEDNPRDPRNPLYRKDAVYFSAKKVVAQAVAQEKVQLYRLTDDFPEELRKYLIPVAQGEL